MADSKERPILFSAPMVRAIQSGQKTQTRRVVKPSVKGCTVGVYTSDDGTIQPINVQDDGDPWHDIPCPYGQPGDRLWVRECWARDDEDASLMYRADVGLGGDADEWEHGRLDGVPRYRWRPSIHMPRWASRITLEVTGVRVERLNEIGHDDAVAEGVDDTRDMCLAPGRIFFADGPRDAFRSPWESINGAGSWDANPWVWVVEFRRLP